MDKAQYLAKRPVIIQCSTFRAYGGEGDIFELFSCQSRIVSLPYTKNLLYPSKCQDEVGLFSFQEYTTFEISDIRTFICVSGIDCLLFVFNYRSVSLMLGNQFRVCLLYATFKITEINGFTSCISTSMV